MKFRRIVILLLAATAALCLCACGDAVEQPSSAEGIATFGMTVDPSAQPSFGQSVPGQSSPVIADASKPGGATGTLGEGDSHTQTGDNAETGNPGGTVDNSGSPSGNAGTPGNTGTNGNPGGNTAVTPSESPTPSPAISPPAPASSATMDEATEYIDKPLSTLIADLGYPYRSDYEDVDEDDPDTDRIGTLYFDGFVVKTLRSADGEIITDVVPMVIPPSPEAESETGENE